MNPTKILLTLITLSCCQVTVASNIVVVGRLVINEPMEYVKDECPENYICLRSWWKSVVQVQKTIRGPGLTGRVTAAVMQHTSLNSQSKKAARLFVLEPIEDADMRAKLRADYYLKDMSLLHQMFCLSQDPKELELDPEDTYVAGTDENKSYCFELPGS
jgi:hypothetical protein